MILYNIIIVLTLYSYKKINYLELNMNFELVNFVLVF